MRILITEDSDLVRAIYTAILKPLGVKYEFATGVEESRRKFKSVHYDLAIFDVDLGHTSVSGRDLLCEYRALYPGGKVYMATSHDEGEFRAFCQTLSAEVIHKGSEFIQALHSALSSTKKVA